MTAPREYKKLPGSTFDIGRIGKYSLWLADDHLLHIRNRGDSEEYKRFYYADIQSLLLRKTSKGTIVNLIFGGFSAIGVVLLGFAYYFWHWQPLPLIGWAAMTFVFAFAFVNNAIRGGTCTCHLQTAVHFQELRSLSRVRSAMKAVAILIDRVEKQQGFLSADQLITASPRQPASGVISSLETPNKYYGGTAHWVLFGLLILQGLQTLLLIFYQSRALFLWTSSLRLPTLIAIVLSIARQRKSTIPGSIKNMVWITLATYIIFAITSYFSLVFEAISNMTPMNFWQAMKTMMTIPPLDSLPWIILFTVKATLYMLLGSVGLMLILRYRKRILHTEQLK